MAPTSADRRHERLLVGALAISLLGDGMFAVAVSFAVFALGGSTLTLGFVVGVSLLALFLAILPAGVAADRWSRRGLVVGSDFVRAACQVAIGVMLVLDDGGTAQLVAVALVFGVATAVHQPATQGFIADSIPTQDLHRVNGRVQAARGLTMVLGAAVAGVLVDTVGPAVVLFVDGGTFAACALLCIFVAPRGTPDEGELPAYASGLAEIRNGMRYVFTRAWLREGVLVMIGFVFVVLGPLQIAGPTLAREAGGAQAWGYLSAAIALGIVVGAVLTTALPARSTMHRVAALALPGAVTQGMLAAGMPYWSALPGYVLLGAAIGTFLPSWEAAKQARVQRTMLSRVASLDWFGSLVGMMSGVAVAVILDEVLGLAAVLWFMAGGLACLAVFVPFQRILDGAVSHGARH